MADHRTAPPDGTRRFGNGPSKRATIRNLSVLKQAEDEKRAHELEIAKAQAPVSGSGQREAALLAASLSRVNDSDDAILKRADKFLAWLQA